MPNALRTEFALSGLKHDAPRRPADAKADVVLSAVPSRRLNGVGLGVSSRPYASNIAALGARTTIKPPGLLDWRSES